MEYTGITCIPYFCKYSSGRDALKLIDSKDKSLVCLCTIDIPCITGEYVIDIYSPNDNNLLKVLLDNNILFKNHRTIRYSNKLYPVCKKNNIYY